METNLINWNFWNLKHCWSASSSPEATFSHCIQTNLSPKPNEQIGLQVSLKACTQRPVRACGPYARAPLNVRIVCIGLYNSPWSSQAVGSISRQCKSWLRSEAKQTFVRDGGNREVPPLRADALQRCFLHKNNLQDVCCHSPDYIRCPGLTVNRQNILYYSQHVYKH